MAKLKEVVYLCIDEFKLISDDADFTEEHLIFLLDKYRALVLKAKKDKNEILSQENYQTICLELTEVPAINGDPCEGNSYLRSIEKVPKISSLGSVKIYPLDFYQGEQLTYVNYERFRYVGNNKFMKNIIYATVGPDDYLYLKSNNPQFYYLEKVKLVAIFDDIEQVYNLQCCKEECSELLDMEYSLDAAYIPEVIQLLTNELLDKTRLSKDVENNANSDLDNPISVTHRQPNGQAK